MKLKKIKSLVIASAGAMLMAQSAQAALTYSNGDLILGIRGSTGTSNLEVDLGSINNILNIAGTGQILTFGTKFTAADITAGVGTAGSGSLNSAIWSVSAAINAVNQNGITAPSKTLWLSSARGLNSSDVSTQTAPWTRGSSTVQGNTAASVLSVGSGFLSGSATAASPNTAAIVADGANSYHDNIVSGDFGNFQGNIENTLAANFTTAGFHSASDLYQMTPGSGNGTYLGHFELGTGGALSFVAVPESGTFAASVAAGFMMLALMRAHRKSLAHS